MTKNKFYITTPIYYVNDVPHIGHAYTTTAADVLARYHRLLGDSVFFLTGTDEHGQKVQKAAEGLSLSPKAHADMMVENFKGLWKKLDISNDAFIRTTDPNHIAIVRDVLMDLYNKGEIVRRNYTGWYCTPDERFWTEKEIVDGKCPDCGRPVEQISEDNYFFLMSRYQGWLIEYIETNPGYIRPESRKNEVLGFLKNQTLGDLCISRPKSRLAWGIPLPFDEDYVTYVWFDALLNYYSATKYLAPLRSVDSQQSAVSSQKETFNSQLQTLNSELTWWPADHHIIGKDILTTHSVYWSTMLKALGLPLPGNIFAHGWWTLQGKKMSKSLGNVVDPNEMIEKYGADAFRYFLFREVPFGLDGDFSEEALIKKINTDLANDLGNLLSRSLTMIEKYWEGKISRWIDGKDGTREKYIQAKLGKDTNSLKVFFSFFGQIDFHNALTYLWVIINDVNRYIEDSAPWREKDKGKLSNILYHLTEALRLIAICLYPFMPSTAESIWLQLGIKEKINEIGDKTTFDEITTWGRLKEGTKIQKGEQLFPRIEKVEIKTGEKK